MKTLDHLVHHMWIAKCGKMKTKQNIKEFSIFKQFVRQKQRIYNKIWWSEGERDTEKKLCARNEIIMNEEKKM